MKQPYSKFNSPFTKIFRTLVILLVTVFSFQAKATHMMGADITYKCLDSLKYQFIVKVYRDCRGVPLSTPRSTLRCASGSGSSATAALKRTGIRDVTPHRPRPRTHLRCRCRPYSLRIPHRRLQCGTKGKIRVGSEKRRADF